MPFHLETMYNSVSWGKYAYQKLTIGLCYSPDIFQEKMNELFNELDYVRTYIDDLLHSRKHNSAQINYTATECLKRVKKYTIITAN